jgi:hypothetical protein
VLETEKIGEVYNNFVIIIGDLWNSDPANNFKARKIEKYHKITTCKLIPGHFFNIERNPYLCPMFSFKKYRSMHVCNHVTKVTKIST